MPLLTTHRCVEHFLWWMDALSWASKSCPPPPPFTAIIKLGRAFFYIYAWLYLSERRKSYTSSMAWGWVNHGVIFIFGWTIPLTGPGPESRPWIAHAHVLIISYYLSLFCGNISGGNACIAEYMRWVRNNLILQITILCVCFQRRYLRTLTALSI